MNKKLTKLLSVFLIAGLIGTGTAVGVAGCKKNKPSTPSNNNQTEQDITWNMKGHGTKPSDAAAQTSGGKVTRPATDPTDDDYNFGGWYKDSACTEEFDFNETYTSAVTVYAKWTAKSSQGDDPGDDQGDAINIVKEFNQEDFEAATENSNKRYYAVGDEVAEGVTVAGKADLEIEANSKKIIYDGAEKSVAYRFKFAGNLFTDKGEGADAYKELNRGLKVEVEKDATLVLYGTSGSGNKTAYLSLAEGVTEGEGADAVTKLTIKDTQQICWKNADMNAVIFKLEAGKTYYVGSDTVTANDDNAANANIYYFEIKSSFDEGKGDKVDAKSATCEEKGVATAYYYTKYGRYLDENGDVLNPNEVFTAALGHKWTYTAADLTKPDATTAGSVDLTCGNDSAHTKQVNLPALKANVYTRTPITTGDDAGKYTYSMKVEGVYEGNEKVDVVTFVAEKVEETKVDYVDISNIVYDKGPNAVYVMSASSEPEQVGDDLYITAGTNNGGAMSNGGTLNVEFYAGSISMDDTESGNILYGVLGFGEAKTEGSYRVSGKLNPTAASSWDPVQIVTSTDISSAQDEKILFALSASGNKKYCMRFGERREESAYDVKDNSSYYFRLDVDLDNHVATVSLSPDGTQWIEIDSVSDESINTFAGVRFQTGSGSRSFSVEEIMISQSMEVDPVVGNYTFVEGKYTLNAAGTANELGYVLSTDNSLKIKADGTSVTDMYGTKLNGTWTKADGYYTGTVQTSPSQSMTMYTVHDEENGVAYVYIVPTDLQVPVATILQGTPYMVFLSEEAELTQTVIDAIAAKHYGEIEAGERENPFVITELSTEDITATGLEQGDDVFYTYKNTGADAVKITVAAGNNTMMYKVTPITDGWNFANITGPFQLEAGETILIAAAAEEDGGISFVFREYNSATDGAVKYTITLDTRGVEVVCPAELETNDEGKLGSNLPQLQNTASAEFLGWELEDGTPVDADTVFDKDTTIYVKWNITAVTFEAQSNAYSYDKIPKLAEQAHVTQAALNGTQNAWLTAVDNGTDFVAYRDGNARIELNNGGLKVYFGAAGTLTLGVKSTGGSNDSLIGLKNEDGDYIAAKNASALTAAAVGTEVAGSSGKVTLTAVAVGAYVIHGGDVVTVQFEVTEAGWYTLYSDRTETTRGIVIASATQTVEAYSLPQNAITATSLELSETAVTVDEQGSATIIADIITNPGVYASTVVWSSEDTNVATVANGVITVLKKGAGESVVITCSVTDSLGNSLSKTVTVTVNHVGATGVSITTPTNSEIQVDDEFTLEYEITTEGEDEATDVTKVEFVSSAPAIATVDETGKVSVVDAGDATITVKVYTLTGGEETPAFTDTYEISIASITATGLKDIAPITLNQNETAQIEAEVEPTGASGYVLTYESNAPAIATVDNNGKVTAVAEGTADITVTLKVGGETVTTKTCAVTVTDKVSNTYSYDYAVGGKNPAAPWTTNSTATNNSTAAGDGSSPVTTCLKVSDTTALTLTATGTKATISVSGFTGKSSNQVPYLKVIACDASGNEIKSIILTSTAGKVNGAYTMEVGEGENKETITTFVIEMEEGVTFSSIKFTCAVAEKDTSISTATVTVLS